MRERERDLERVRERDGERERVRERERDNERLGGERIIGCLDVEDGLIEFFNSSIKVIDVVFNGRFLNGNFLLVSVDEAVVDSALLESAKMNDKIVIKHSFLIQPNDKESRLKRLKI